MPRPPVSPKLMAQADPVISEEGQAKKQKRRKAAEEVQVEELPEAVAAPEEPRKKKSKKKAAAEAEEPSVETEAPAKKKSKSKEELETPAEGELMDPDAYREKCLIRSAIEGQKLPDPVQRFDDAPFSKKVRAALVAAGFPSPSPIQAQGWPVAALGQDLVAVAKTGSGKTLGFLLPGFQSVAKEEVLSIGGVAAPPMLVLAPTRELACQIEVECNKFSDFGKVSAASVYGGVPKGPQVKALRDHPQCVIATPGRLQDLVEMGSVRLDRVRFLVLDEADRMLDMGFEPTISEIVTQTAKERQTLLFTATWPKAVQKIAQNYLQENHVHVNVGETEELAANKSVKQTFYPIGDDEKEMRLWRIMGDLPDNAKLIAFMNTKRRVEQYRKSFEARGFEVAALHGDKAQKDRDWALAKFSKGELWIMFATDVCARGLDIKDVTHVINFDMARDVESYVHRIGRTGRAGASGESITFWNEAYDMECAPALAKIAREAGQEVPPFLEKAAEKQANAKTKLWKY